MQQAERAQTVVGHDLRVGMKTLVKGKRMDVGEGEKLRAQQQRGDRQRAPSGLVSKTALRSLIHRLGRAPRLTGSAAARLPCQKISDGATHSSIAPGGLMQSGVL